MIAFTSGEFGRQWKAVWVGGTSGESPRKLVSVGDEEEVFSPVWSPDGNWIAYGRSWKTSEGSWRSSIEARPVSGGAAKTLVTESSLPAKGKLSLAVSPWFVGGWTTEGRLVFTVAQDAGSPSIQTKYSLWDVQVDPSTGSVHDQPRQVSGWSESKPRNVTVTSDGKRLTMLRERFWLDTYVGELAADGARMRPPRRFTLDDRGSTASGWTHDSQAVLFDSPRNGKREIFSQSVNENVVERMVFGSGDVNGGVMSPDGARLLYWESVAGTSDGTVRLMSQGVGGGRPEILLEAPAQEHRYSVACSSNPHAIAPCVTSLNQGKDLVFFAVDPQRGKGNRLGKIEVFGAYEDWGLSPDGASVALVDADKYDGRIEILNLSNGAWHEIVVGPGGEHLQSIAWAADGRGFFATPHSPYLYNVLHITLSGRVQRLLESGRPQWMVSPLPSPDGKYLAFDAQTWASNVWMIDKF
jgi:Tol biopolymer transport system component